MINPQDDPFGGTSYPSISWKNATPGTVVSGIVAERPEVLQGRDYETGQPAEWPDGKPKMVVRTTLDIDGVLWNLWAQQPSALFAAIRDAQNKAGAQILPGGRLAITYTHDEPNKSNPRLNPAKQFTAIYGPPDAFAAAQYEQPPTMVATERRSDEQLAQQPAQPGQASAPAAAAPAPNPGQLAEQLIASGLDDATIAQTTGLPMAAVAALRNLAAQRAS